MLQTLSKVKWSLLATVAAVIIASIFITPLAGITTLVLIAIEIAFSFDNAVVNAKILGQLSPLWQRLFLTIGIVVAVIGMRLVFPILIVAISASLGFGSVVNLALHDSEQYAHYLELAHPAISAFGGAFLLTLAFYFLFDDDREDLWLRRLEARLQRIGGYWWLAPLTALVAVVIVAFVPGNHHLGTTLRAGSLGVLLYTAMHQGIAWLDSRQPKLQGGAVRTGLAAFTTFMYLQLLDASFSFDGVLGAFAITNNVLLIALGLGVGALWVRTLTVQLVKHQALDAYIYLEHGAHYAILALAAALLVSIIVAIPDAITGLVGIVIIIVSFQASRQVRTRKT